MAKYFTQFDEATQTVGTTLAGWTARGSATPTCVPAIGPVAQMSIKRRYCKFGPTSTADHACVSLDSIDADTGRDKFNLLTLVVLPLATVTVHSLFARGQGSAPPTDYYRAKANSSGGNLTISLEKRVASAAVVSLASTALGAWPSTTSFWLRFQGNGTALSATAWAVGTAEPAAVTVSATDAALSAAGFVGIGGFGNGLICAFNFFSVGTNGDAPDIPLTEAEFNAWCDDQSKQREILAEFSALGYDPTGAGSPAYTKTVNAYISRLGFTSRAHDVPASQHYPAIITQVPSFSAEMPAALGGEARINIGDLVIDNARPSVQPQESTTVGLKFDGVQKVELSATTNVPAVFTLECWTNLVNPIAYSVYTLFWNAGDNAAAPTNGYQFGIDNLNGRPFIAKWVAGVSTARYADDRTLTFNGQPHHVAVVCNGTTALFFVDGVQVPAVSSTFVAVSLTGKGRIGNTASPFYDVAKGSIDEVRLWNTARTAAEILAYKNVRATGSETGLIGCWHMDEGSGTTTADASPTGNNGTLTSATMWSMTGMPKASLDWGGVRDDWLRMKFNKNYLRMWIGDKSWPKHDFREYITGVIGQPTAPNETEINFKIADLSAFFQKDLQTSLFTSGAYSGQRKPIFMGQIGRGSHVGGQIEPPLTDVANLIYTISDAAIGAWYTSLTDYMRVFDRQTELRTAALTNSAVAGNTLTSSVAHGMVVNYLWRSPASGALPTPLALNTDYWVQSAPTTTTFTLSATRGGAVIALTSATLVAVASYGYGYTVTSAAPASIQLASGDPNQMRVTVSDILTSAAGSYATGCTPKQVYADIIARTGLSANFIDTGTVYSLSNDCGLWWDTQKHSVADALNTFANGSLSFYGFSADGLFYSGAMAVPAGTAVQSFGTFNIQSRSMRHAGSGMRRAVDFSKAEISYAPWFLTGGAFQTGSQAALQGRSITAPTVYGAVSPPLDNFPAAGEADGLFSVTHFFTSSTPVTVYSTFYAKPTDEFEFKTSLRAFRRRIGEVISVTYPRFGFKRWSVTDPASLDNTATIDGTLCVIEKISVAPLANPPVTLQVYKPRIGYYPTVNLTP